LKAYPVEADALINTWRIESDLAFDRIFYRTGEDFAVGNIAIASADDRRNPFDAESEIGSRAFDLHAIGFFHQRFKRFHPGLQFSVIQSADFEIEIFESFRAHGGKLRHRRSRP